MPVGMNKFEYKFDLFSEHLNDDIKGPLQSNMNIGTLTCGELTIAFGTVTSMSVLLIMGRKCTLAASIAAPDESR